MNQNNVVCLGRIPHTMTKIQLKILLKEICHIDVKLKAIDEYIVPDFKVVFVDYGDNVIPTIAMDRLKRFGGEILTKVAVRCPSLMPGTRNFYLPPHVLEKYNMAPFNTKPIQTALKTVQWLHYELHLKYPQLHIIDLKHEHTVYEGLRNTITQRVMHIMTPIYSKMVVRNTLALYRKMHPHFADFEMVMSHIASAEKMRGLPPTHYTEAELLVPTPPPAPEAEVRQLWEKNSKVLNDKVQSYIASLDTEKSDEDSPEMVLRKKIRLTMKQFSDQLPQMVTYEPRKDLSDTPDWICLYFLGEPTLPTPIMINLYLEKHGVEYFQVAKCIGVPNALRVYIPRDQYDKVMEHNGCDPLMNRLKLSTTTDIIYIRHTNDPYTKEKYIVPTLKTLNTKWAARYTKPIVYNRAVPLGKRKAN